MGNGKISEDNVLSHRVWLSDAIMINWVIDDINFLPKHMKNIVKTDCTERMTP